MFVGRRIARGYTRGHVRVARANSIFIFIFCIRSAMLYHRTRVIFLRTRSSSVWRRCAELRAFPSKPSPSRVASRRVVPPTAASSGEWPRADGRRSTSERTDGRAERTEVAAAASRWSTNGRPSKRRRRLGFEDEPASRPIAPQSVET